MDISRIQALIFTFGFVEFFQITSGLRCEINVSTNIFEFLTVESQKSTILY